MVDHAFRRRSLTAVTGATFAVAVTLGLTWPLLALVLAARGVAPAVIGLSSAAQMAAIVVVVPLAPWLMARFGTLAVITGALTIVVAMLLALPAVDDVRAWYPIRFALGAGAEVLLVAADVWVNQVAEERTRGRTVGLYGLALSAGFAAGPLIVGITGTEGWAPFVVAAAIAALGAVPLAFVRDAVPAIEGRPTGRLWHFVRIAPTLMLAGLMFGLIDAAVLSFLPLYGLAHGFDQATATLLVTALIGGSVIGQLPLGWLADRLDGRLVAIGCGAANLLAGFALPLAIATPWALWPLLLVWGVAAGGFYTVAMVMMGRSFSGADLVAVNAALVVVWGAGGIVGPMVAGAAVEAIGREGLPATVVACSVAFLVLALIRYRATRRP